MINRIKSLLFVICIITLFIARSGYSEERERSEGSREPVSRAVTVHEPVSRATTAQEPVSRTPVTQHVSEVRHNQEQEAKPRVESTARASQTIHKAAPQTHIAQPARVAQLTRQERPAQTPRVYAFASSVRNDQSVGRQHHNYWHPRYNFYNHQYHFYPYINIVSRVELSPNCIIVPFDEQTYYYDYCVFYVQEAGGYLAVPPPIGIIVSRISSHAVQVIINGRLYYTYNDVYYEPVPGGYLVVEPLR